VTPDLEAVRGYIGTLADGDTIPVRVALLRALFDLTERGEPVERLLTTADLGRRYGVAESTARAWVAAGKCPGAEKFAGLGWRIPPSALPSLEANLRESDVADLGAWRASRRPDRGAA